VKYFRNIWKKEVTHSSEITNEFLESILSTSDSKAKISSFESNKTLLGNIKLSLIQRFHWFMLYHSSLQSGK
jgi:hypothetical protein